MSDLCNKEWIGMSQADPAPTNVPARCQRRVGHLGICGPKAGWLWVDDRDAALDLLGPQRVPWDETADDDPRLIARQRLIALRIMLAGVVASFEDVPAPGAEGQEPTMADACSSMLLMLGRNCRQLETMLGD